MIPIREKIGRICGFTARELSVTPTWGDKKPPKDEKNKKRPFSDLNMAEQFEQFNKFLKAQDGYLSE